MSQAMLSEAEVQVLASLHKAEDKNTPTDKAALEEGGERQRGPFPAL